MKVYKENSRSSEQTARMEFAEQNDLCPFCEEGLIKVHKLATLKETRDFFVTPNAFPYDGTRCHYLIIPKQHITSAHNIPPEAWSQIGLLFNWTINKYAIENGAMFLRFGTVFHTGSSVTHIHFQIIAGTKSEKDTGHESLKVKLGYK